LAFSATKSMLKTARRTYLPPNSQSMQKTIEGGSSLLAARRGIQVSILLRNKVLNALEMV